MKSFDSGVSYYTQGTITISFPEDDICCEWCPLMGIETLSNRHYCRRTGEYLPATKHLIGSECPIIFKEEEK